MKQKTDKKGTRISTLFGVFLMVLITIILAATIAAFVFGVGFEDKYYKILTEEHPNKDFLSVTILNYANNSPLSDVTIKVLEHGEGRLLSGPYMTNESGYTIIQIPQGYEEYFDIVGEYQNITNTKTVDKRSPLVKLETYLGSLGVQIVVVIFSIIIGIYIQQKRKNRMKKCSKRT
ncbi:MAG TPA: type IV pilin N-terminal domain-containing protein [Candidatus Methanoperedens sp.]